MRFRNRQRETPKPKREYSVRWLEDKLDDLTSQIIRARNPRCILCGSVVQLENGHLFTRTWRPTRWDLEVDGNCHTLCHKCNMEHEGNPAPFRKYYVANFGKRALERLERRAHSHDKMGYSDMINLWERYKSILAKERGRAA